MDIDAIALGEDFVKAIETTVAKCDVLIAIIRDCAQTRDSCDPGSRGRRFNAPIDGPT
jgi:hypothetical protein